MTDAVFTNEIDITNRNLVLYHKDTHVFSTEASMLDSHNICDMPLAENTLVNRANSVLMALAYILVNPKTGSRMTFILNKQHRSDENELQFSVYKSYEAGVTGQYSLKVFNT